MSAGGEVEHLDLDGGEFGFIVPENHDLSYPSADDQFLWPPIPAPSFSPALLPQTSDTPQIEENTTENPRKRHARQEADTSRPVWNGPIKTRLVYEFSTPLPNRWKYSMSVWNLKTLELMSCDSDFVNLLEIPVSILSRSYKWPEVFPMNALAYPTAIRSQVAASGRRLHHANTLMLANRLKFVNHNLAMISGTGRLKFLHLVVAVVDDKDGNPCEGFALGADVTEAGAFPIPEDPLPGFENDPSILTRDPQNIVNVVPCELPPAPTGFSQTSISRPFNILQQNSSPCSSSDTSSEPASPNAPLAAPGGIASNVASSFSTPSGSSVTSLIVQDPLVPRSGSRVYTEFPLATTSTNSNPPTPMRTSPPTGSPAAKMEKKAYLKHLQSLIQQQQEQFQQHLQQMGLQPPPPPPPPPQLQLHYLLNPPFAFSAPPAPQAVSSPSLLARPPAASSWTAGSAASTPAAHISVEPHPNAAASASAALPSSASYVSTEMPEPPRSKPWEDNVVKFKWKRPQKWTNMPSPATHHTPQTPLQTQHINQQQQHQPTQPHSHH